MYWQTLKEKIINDNYNFEKNYKFKINLLLLITFLNHDELDNKVLYINMEGEFINYFCMLIFLFNLQLINTLVFIVK